MGTLIRRPQFKGNKEVEALIKHMIPHGIYHFKTQALRSMFDGARKRTIMGVVDVTNRLTEMTADATGILLMKNTGVIGNSNEKMEQLPANARVTKAWYEVATTFTSSADGATLAFGIPTDDAAGIVAAVDIADVGDPWDAAGAVDAIQDGTTAAFGEKTTAARDIVLDLGGAEALTAGLLYFYFEYVETF